jgi:hypothetical protein
MSNRLPEIQLDNADEEQRDVILEIFAERGKTEGILGHMFAMYMNSPQAARRMGSIGAYARFYTPVPVQLRETAILTSCYRNDYLYEIDAHEEIAQDQGMTRAQLHALRDGRWEDLDDDIALVGRFAEAVVSGRLVDEALVDEVRATFGDRLVIDLALSAAYYALLHMMSNVVDPELDAPGHGLTRPDNEVIVSQ